MGETPVNGYQGQFNNGKVNVNPQVDSKKPQLCGNLMHFRQNHRNKRLFYGWNMWKRNSELNT